MVSNIPKLLWEMLLLFRSTVCLLCGICLVFYLSCDSRVVASAPTVIPSEMAMDKQAEKPITILTSHNSKLGYNAVAHAVTHVLAGQFPGRRIRLILDYDEDKADIREKFNRMFQFPDQVEILYLPGKGKVTRDADSYNAEDRALAQQWLDESSLVIIALNFLGRGLKLSSEQCFVLRQLDIRDFWTGRQLPCYCKYRMNLGLGPDDYGMLLEPQLLQKAEQGMPSAFADDFNRAMEEYPELAHFIHLTETNSSSSTPKYYVAYQHVDRNFAEFIAIVSHLEGDSAELWILSDMDDSFLKRKMITAFLTHQNIGKLIYYPPSAPPRETMLRAGGSTVHFVRLPHLKNDLHYALLAYSQQVVGVTSNHSSFIAMALGKLPVYLSYTALQKEVNYHLSEFNPLFQSLFTRGQNPAEKARDIKANQASIASWSKTIVALKSANAGLISRINQHEGRECEQHWNRVYKGGDCQWPIFHQSRIVTDSRVPVVIPIKNPGSLDDIYYLAPRVMGFCALVMCVYVGRALQGFLGHPHPSSLMMRKNQ